MNIIICGAGQVGYSIANQLSQQGHSITVIDKTSSDIQKINDNLDAKGIVGIATYPSVLELADAKNTVARVRKIRKPFARKIQILTVGEQRAKVMNKNQVVSVFKKAKEADIGEVYVATEDKEILDDVHLNGGKAILTSNKHKTGSDRIFECYEKLDLKNIDYIINLQGDEPNIDIGDLKHLNKLLKINSPKMIEVKDIKSRPASAQAEQPPHAKQIDSHQHCRFSASFRQRHPPRSQSRA